MLMLRFLYDMFCMFDVVLLSGAVMIVLAFMVSQMGTVLQASYSVYAIINGPIFGVFVLGMIFPWANNIVSPAHMYVHLRGQ